MVAFFTTMDSHGNIFWYHGFDGFIFWYHRPSWLLFLLPSALMVALFSTSGAMVVFFTTIDSMAVKVNTPTRGGATDQTARTIFNTQDHMSPLTLAQDKLALSFKKTSAEIEQHGRAYRCGGAWAWL